MFEYHGTARSSRIRAVFLSARHRSRLARTMGILSLILLQASCAPAAFRVERAALFPLYAYDPGSRELTAFMALDLTVTAGDIEVSGIELEQESSGTRWSWVSSDSDDAEYRQPEPADSFVRPDFYSERPGSQLNRLYPWFVVPDGMEPGLISIRIFDLSRNQGSANAAYRPLPEDDLGELSEALRFSDAGRISHPGAWEYLVVSSTDGSILRRLEYRAGEPPSLEEIADIPADALWYYWGVPADYDCLMLVGPYLR
jgi:hypothetical protein